MNLKKIIASSKLALTKAQEKIRNIQKKLKIIKENHKQNKKSPKKKEISITKNRITVDLSVISVTKAALSIIGLLILTYLLYEIRNIILLLFISLFFASACNPLVDHMENKKIPRWLGIIIIYITIVTIIAFFFVQIIPLVVEQIKEIAINMNSYLKTVYFDFVHSKLSIPFLPQHWNDWLREFFQNLKLNQLIDFITSNLTDIRKYLEQLATGSIEALKTAGSAAADTVSIIVSFIFNLVILIFFVFFIVVSKKDISGFFTSLFPKKYGPYIICKTNAIQKKIGGWVNGTLMLSTSMFILSLVGLLIFDIKYALTLALLTGAADIIPYLGPFIAYSIIVPVALNQSFFTFLWITLWFIGIQQIESNILIPLIMHKAVGLNPIAIMVSMLIGFKFLGILGIIISIPIATSISIFIDDYTEKNKVVVKKCNL